MNFTIRDPIDVQFTKAPAIAIAGASGSGKTESAMRLARGWCDFFSEMRGKKEKFVVIDTEEKRALYKKDRHQPWDWVDFQPPFSPERTWEALHTVRHYEAVVLDSGSHEYAGEGGISDDAEDALERMAKGDPVKAEKLTSLAWKDPKRRHKRKLMANLIRYPKLLIVCLRAEPKIKFAKDGEGKTKIIDMGFQPICEKMFMYEMLASFMMYADRAGIPEQVKTLEEDLRPVFLEGQRIDESTGRRLAQWAHDRAESSPSASTTITADQALHLEKLCKTADLPVDKFLEKANIFTLTELAVADYPDAVASLERRIERRKSA